jgi:hypothetical protein
LTTTGSFTGVRNPHLTYDSNNVFLVLDPNALLPLLPPGTPLNPVNVARAIDNFIAGGGTLLPNYLELFNLTGGKLANALSQLSGEAATGARQGAFQLTGQFLGIMLDPFVYGRGDIEGGPAPAFAPEREALPEEVALAYASAPAAARSASITASPPTPLPALLWPAASPIGTWRRASAAAEAMPSRLAPTRRRDGGRRISPPHSPSPIIGCRPTALPPSATISPPTLTPRASAAGWRAATASGHQSAG